MPALKNDLKAALAAGKNQFGCWLNMVSPMATEIVARAGFDWALIDGEHGANSIPTIAQQLQILDGKTPAIVRVPTAETWVIKQALDAGAQSIMTPIIETGAQAQEMVDAVRYPPIGKRGVGSSVARAAQFGNIKDYLTTADSEICLIIQLETRMGLENLDDMLAVEGVDCVFIGPSDLSADMGYLGNPNADEVQDAIKDALTRIRAAGKAAGILALNDADAEKHVANGANFVGIASDVLTFNAAVTARAKKWVK